MKGEMYVQYWQKEKDISTASTLCEEKNKQLEKEKYNKC